MPSSPPSTRAGWRAVALVCGLLSGVPSLAEEGRTGEFTVRDTAQLHQLCSGAQATVSHEKARAFCYGYVLAALHYDYALHRGDESQRLVCPQEKTSLRDVIEEFVGWVEKNPKHRGDLPVEGLMRSAMARWPCSRNTTP